MYVDSHFLQQNLCTMMNEKYFKIHHQVKSQTIIFVDPVIKLKMR